MGDAASFDAELLQLNEVSPLALKSNPIFVETLFDYWLSLPDTNRLVLCSTLFHVLQINVDVVLLRVGYESSNSNELLESFIWFLNCGIVLAVNYLFMSFMFSEICLLVRLV